MPRQNLQPLSSSDPEPRCPSADRMTEAEAWHASSVPDSKGAAFGQRTSWTPQPPTSCGRSETAGKGAEPFFQNQHRFLGLALTPIKREQGESAPHKTVGYRASARKKASARPRR